MRRLLAVVAFTSVIAAVWAVACGNQGEGGQCNTLDNNSGDDDCSNGDFCMAASQASGVWASYGSGVPGFGYCCPNNRTQATTAQCSLAASVPNGNQGLPPDSGTSSGSTSDGASDAPSDSPEAVDAPADAPLDAPGD